jgi:hypothetical protein
MKTLSLSYQTILVIFYLHQNQAGGCCTDGITQSIAGMAKDFALITVQPSSPYYALS